ncbi:MAG: cytoskeletal protein CcmA (bactofilin family) [Polyangiales bacterium]|jgi:cytoskeletal protein CcmA (bactofilin family)
MRPRPSIIPAGVVIEGSIDGDGDLIVLGRVEGPIRLVGSLSIEEGAVVRGHVHARVVSVSGVLKGDAYGDDLVRIEAKARMVGDVRAPRIKVVRGAQLSGKLHMGEVHAPTLATYDAGMHTFTGQPAPSVQPETRVLDVRGDGLPTSVDIPSPARAVETEHAPRERPSKTKRQPGGPPGAMPIFGRVRATRKER